MPFQYPKDEEAIWDTDYCPSFGDAHNKFLLFPSVLFFGKDTCLAYYNARSVIP